MHNHANTTPEPPRPYTLSSPSSTYPTAATQGSGPSINGDDEAVRETQQRHNTSGNTAEDGDRAPGPKSTSAPAPAEGQQGANGVVSAETQRALEEQERARQLVAAYQYGLIPYYYANMGGGYGRYGPGWY